MEKKTLAELFNDAFNKKISLESEYKFGSHTKVKLWLDMGEVLEFCCNQELDLERRAGLMKEYFGSAKSLQNLTNTFARGVWHPGSQNTNPPLRYIIESSAVKTKKVCIKDCKGNKKTELEYFSIPDFSDKGFLEKFEALTGAKVKRDFLAEGLMPKEFSLKELKKCRPPENYPNYKGNSIERFVFNLIFHPKTLPGYIDYRLGVKGRGMETSQKGGSLHLKIYGEAHIEFFGYGGDR